MKSSVRSDQCHTVKSDVVQQVQQCVENLKRQHGERFTPMQYRVWSEMINGGMRKSTVDPPSTTMFKRCDIK